MRVREANEGWAAFVARLVANRYGGRQVALAEDIGVASSTVTRWLDGATPAIPQLRAISEAVDVPMVELLQRAGALDPGALDLPSQTSPPDATVDTAEAIERDPRLIEEAKQHLLNQYELLLRLPPAGASTRVEKPTRRAAPPDAPLRAVARGGDPKDRAEVRRIARQARRQHEQNAGEE